MYTQQQLKQIEVLANSESLECGHCGSAMIQDAHTIDEFYCSTGKCNGIYVDEDGDIIGV